MLSIRFATQTGSREGWLLGYGRGMAPLRYRRHASAWDHPARDLALSPLHPEELLAERGLDISYETVRRWVLKFAPRSLDGCAGIVLGQATDGIRTR